MRKEIIEEDLRNIYVRDIPWGKLEGSTILVTGAYGMLASYMVFMLLYLNECKGMHIRIICIVKSKEKFEKRFGSIDRFRGLEVYGGRLDERLDLQMDIDYIVHAASLASPHYYKVCPVEVLMPNVIGSYWLLKLAEKKNLSGYLLFSTGEVYGKVSGVGAVSEQDYGALDTLDIHSCYGESKRMAETMCKAWYCQKGIPVKIVRIWHTYAPTLDIHTDSRVFASFASDVIHRRDIAIKGNGNAKRSFCYIADAVAGYFLVLLRGACGEAYNVSNTKEFYSIYGLAQEIVNLYPELGLRVIKEKRAMDDNYLENRVANDIPPDSSKLERLGWNAQYSVKDGFLRVIESFEER